MDILKFNTAAIVGKTVLIAPLDWGLGHATRCIPIINALLKRENRVIIAATGSRKAILAETFPGLKMVELPDYEVRLSASPGRLNSKLLRQFPRLWFVIKQEKKWLDALCRTETIDLVISDNRYGLFHKSVHCIFITHQLFIISGFGNRADRWLMRFHFRLIGRFRECWVPDNADPEKSLAGRLSHPPETPAFPVTYLGLLSRFAGIAHSNVEEYAKTELLILLSGPEPQRTLLENVVIRQLVKEGISALLVRGLPHLEAVTPDSETPGDDSRLRVVNHLRATALALAISRAGTIVCRSGYSTLMDLIALRRSAVLIPTPGQPEQEYLAGYMEEKGWMSQQKQATCSLKELGAQELANPGKKQHALPEPGLVFFNGELPGLTLQ